MNNKRNSLISSLAIVVGMFCLAFASVPLYDLFCRVTGYGGTTQRVNSVPKELGKRELKISFNADTGKNLPWDFKPQQRRIETITGKRNLVFYEATNIGEKPVSGTAIYNVTPLKAGGYFSKIECFCFEKQLLKPGEKMVFPVSFYVDPEIENDPYLSDVKEITLSYSFFKDVENEK